MSGAATRERRMNPAGGAARVPTGLTGFATWTAGSNTAAAQKPITWHPDGIGGRSEGAPPWPAPPDS